MTTRPPTVKSGLMPGTIWPDDTTLIQECLRGEEAAWNAILSKYKNLIFSIPIKWGFSQDDSSDIFQAVCLDLLCELKHLREPRALPGWLIRVTWNCCFHHGKLRRRYDSEIGWEDVAEATQDIPDHRLHELQREETLRAALRSLSPRCHKLVEMLFFESPIRPYDEIASSLALAKGSIGPIRRRCLEHLRSTLEEGGSL